MRRFLGLLALLVAATGLARAETLSDQQLLGRRLYQQSCGVCHTRPTLQSPLFGPALSKATFAQGDDQPRRQIANGSPNMPGFKYNFTGEQIDAIVAFLKTTDTPPANPPQAQPAAANSQR